MIRAFEIAGSYGDGEYLRRWSLVGGRARCIDDAYAVADTDPAVLDAQRAVNDEVRLRLGMVEDYEAALALAAAEEPPAEVDGQPNPAWAAWDAAAAAVAAADPDTLALHAQRHAAV